MAQRNTKKTQEEFELEVFELVDKEYSVLGAYITARTKVEMKHLTCGHRYEVSPTNFLRGDRCPHCYRSIKKTTETFKKDVKSVHGSDYVVLGEYVNNSTKLRMKHLICGFIYEPTPYNVLSGTRCPNCFGKIKKTTETFKKEVETLEGDGYQILSEYINGGTKVVIKHVICGSEYEVVPNNFLNGKRCPKCSESKGEQKVSEFLLTRGIKNIREYTDSACRDKRVLPFDFAVEKAEKIVALIEYDGGQHHFPVKHFGGEKTFRAVQRRDAIKTQYCADKGIPLIRIPYWNFDNIDAILTEKLLPLLKDADKHNAG